MDRQAARDDLQARLLVMRRCGVFEMTGGHGTVRGLTFEHTRLDSAIALIEAFQDTSGVVGLSAAIAVDGRLIFAVADGSLLGRAATDEMWRKQTPGERDPTYGLGWVILERDGRRLVGHSGGTPGATAMLLLAPDDRAAVAILSNTEVVVANLAELILGIFLTVHRE